MLTPFALMHRKAPAKSSSSTGLILDISDTLLTTIRDAARVSTVPFFQEAADLALGIVKIIQGTKDNKDGFKQLATDVCALVYAIIRADKEQKGMSPKDLDNVKELLGTLVSIERFARRKASQPLLLRVVRHNSDAGKIQQYRVSLKQSLDLFGVRANLSIQETISRIAQRQEDFFNVLQDSPLVKQGNRGLDQEGSDSRIVETENQEHERIEKERRLGQHREERLEKQRVAEGKAKERLEEAAEEDARMEAERVEREKLERQRLETERLARGKEHLEAEKREKETLQKEELVRAPGRAAEEEQEAQDKRHHAVWNVQPVYVPPFKPTYSSKNPFLQPHQPTFPVIHSSHGSFTSVGGDYVKTDNSNHENNTHSGNTTTTTVMDSHNDSSALTVYPHYPKRRKNR